MTPPDILAITKHSDVSITLDTCISPLNPAFSGHFPGEPILPGVVQIDWVLQFATQLLGITSPAARDFKVKFTQIIRPNMPLSLTLKYNPSKKQLEFTYHAGAEIMSSGLIKQLVHA